MLSPHERQLALSALATLSRRDLAAIWHKLNLSKPDKLAEPLAQVLGEITDRYGAAAASLAADWYDEARAEANAPGKFPAVLADPPSPDRLDALAGWGIGPLFGANPDSAAALSLLAGGLQRIVLDQARDTTYGSVGLDPAGPRYARHASANACAFCRMLASRGATYVSEKSASRVVGRGAALSSNVGRTKGRKAQGVQTRGSRPLEEKFHDDCHCVAVEVFPGTEIDEAPYVDRWRQTYNDVKVTHGPYGAIDTKATLAAMRDAMGIH